MADRVHAIDDVLMILARGSDKLLVQLQKPNAVYSCRRPQRSRSAFAACTYASSHAAKSVGA
jgi:hypothetical protein